MGVVSSVCVCGVVRPPPPLLLSVAAEQIKRELIRYINLDQDKSKGTDCRKLDRKCVANCASRTVCSEESETTIFAAEEGDEIKNVLSPARTHHKPSSLRAPLINAAAIIFMSPMEAKKARAPF